MYSLISIITPLHNSGATIHVCISSVLSQSYTNWELLIIDDNSTDNSKDIIDPLIQNDKRIKYFRLNENMGAGYTRNYGISKARGKYITFLDSDDIWLPEKLSKQYHFMEENDIDFSYTPYEIIDSKERQIKTFTPRQKVNYNMILKTCDIGCSTVMYNCEKLGKQYMELIKRGQDYTLWLRILKITKYAFCLNIPLTKYRILKSSISRNKVKKAKSQWFIYRRIEKLPLSASFYYFIHYSYYGYLKNRF